MSPKLWVYLFFSLFVLAGSFPGWAEGKDLLLDPAVVHRTVLKNGMTIITQEVHTHPLVSINFFVRAGGITESPSESGISHFCEHLFFRGSLSRSGAEMKLLIRNLGGRTNAETTKDFTRYYLNLPSRYLREGLDIMSDALLHPSLQPQDIEQERKVIIEEYRLHQENPGDLLSQRLYARAYEEHPYRLPLAGTEENLRRFKVGDFIDYHERFYVPENVTLVLVGDFEEEKLLPQVRTLFKDFKSSGRERPFTPREEAPLTPKEEVIRRSTQDAFFVMGFHAPGMVDRKDIPAVDLLTFLLGKGEGALLQRDLVSKERVVKSLGVDFLTQKDPGLLTIFAMADPKKMEKAKGEVLGKLGEIREGKIRAEDLERARGLLIGAFIQGLETNDGKAGTYGFYESIGSLSFVWNYLDAIRTVSTADITRVAQQYLGGGYTFISILPLEEREHEKTGD